MENLKIDMVITLFELLAQANNSDCFEDGKKANDLPINCCDQDNLYGSIGESIKFLGYEPEYLYWVESGDTPDTFDLSDESIVKVMLDSNMFDNDIWHKIAYIMERNSKYKIDFLLQLYEK